MAPNNFNETYPICRDLMSLGDIGNSLLDFNYLIFENSSLAHADNDQLRVYNNQIDTLFPDSGIFNLSDLLGNIGRSLYCIGNCTMMIFRENDILRRISFIPPNYRDIPMYGSFENLPEGYEIVNITTENFFDDGFGRPLIYNYLDTYIALNSVYGANMATLTTYKNYPNNETYDVNHHYFLAQRALYNRLSNELGFIRERGQIIGVRPEVGEQIIRITLIRFREHILNEIQESYNLDSLPDVLVPNYPEID